MTSVAEKQAFVTISLDRFLREGEIVAHFTKTETFYATYKRGYLIPHGSTSLDKGKKFESLTNFCNDHSKSKVNGWKACQVFRDKQWIKMEDLKRSSEGTTVTTPKGTKQIKDSEEDMPPPKKTASVTQRKLGTIIASIVEDEKPALEVSSIIRIRLQPTTIDGKKYWFNSTSTKVYEIGEKDGVGAYKGKLDVVTMKVDEDAIDSDID